jgi:hypothetical protein
MLECLIVLMLELLLECLIVLMLELLLECLIVLMLEWLAQLNYLNNKAIRQSSNQYNVLVLNSRISD